MIRERACINVILPLSAADACEYGVSSSPSSADVADVDPASWPSSWRPTPCLSSHASHPSLQQRNMTNNSAF